MSGLQRGIQAFQPVSSLLKCSQAESEGWSVLTSAGRGRALPRAARVNLYCLILAWKRENCGQRRRDGEKRRASSLRWDGPVGWARPLRPELHQRRVSQEGGDPHQDRTLRLAKAHKPRRTTRLPLACNTLVLSVGQGLRPGLRIYLESALLRGHAGHPLALCEPDATR